MTLPLIHALNQAPKAKKRHIINLIKNKSHVKKHVQEVIDFVKASEGISYAKSRMEEYRSQALTILRKFPNNESRQSIESLVDFVIQRNR